jgi:diaminopropionate ammonia-lyase
MNMNSIQGIRYIINESPDHGKGPAFLSPAETASVQAFHEALPEYARTALVPLPELAKSLGIRAAFIKDESTRFGLKAFKGLGGSYAVFRAVCDRLGLDYRETSIEELQSDNVHRQIAELHFVTATDGNHGKGVAWAAAKLGCQAHVYLPKGSVQARAQAIRDIGKTEAVITDLGYDDTVRYAAKLADEHEWVLIQDTSWPGYEDIPRTIIQGYTTMCREASEQLEELGFAPTHVFLQAGVGAMAGGVLGWLRNRYPDADLTAAIVEPTEAACVFESVAAADGKMHPAAGSGRTIMAVLNCGEVCPLTWPILLRQADTWFSCPDQVAVQGMRYLYRAGVVSGESGAVRSGIRYSPSA